MYSRLTLAERHGEDECVDAPGGGGGVQPATPPSSLDTRRSTRSFPQAQGPRKVSGDSTFSFGSTDCLRPATELPAFSRVSSFQRLQQQQPVRVHVPVRKRAATDGTVYVPSNPEELSKRRKFSETFPEAEPNFQTNSNGPTKRARVDDARPATAPKSRYEGNSQSAQQQQQPCLVIDVDDLDTDESDGELNPPTPSAPKISIVLPSKPTANTRQPPESPPDPPGSQSPRHTDDEGHFIARPGEYLNNRYLILAPLGEGTFSKVVETFDEWTGHTVAIKVIRAIKKYTDSAILEMRTLRELTRNDSADRVCFIKPREEFTSYGHMCIVFNRLGMSLYDFMKANEYRGFCLRDIRDMARSLLECTAFCHSLKLVHTDLKPENILLESDDFVREPVSWAKIPKSTRIRIIDFGSSVWENQHHPSLIQTRHYRAPEVVVGTPWSYPADMWSVGCILVELLTGKALFQTHDSHEHLCMMEKVLGYFPHWLGKTADVKNKGFFHEDNSLRPMPPASDGEKFVAKLKSLQVLLEPYPDFYDLVLRMLQFDPRKRITADQALAHPFFARTISSLTPLGADPRSNFYTAPPPPPSTAAYFPPSPAAMAFYLPSPYGAFVTGVSSPPQYPNSQMGGYPVLAASGGGAPSSGNPHLYSSMYPHVSAMGGALQPQPQPYYQ